MQDLIMKIIFINFEKNQVYKEETLKKIISKHQKITGMELVKIIRPTVYRKILAVKLFF